MIYEELLRRFQNTKEYIVYCNMAYKYLDIILRSAVIYVL